MHAVELAPDPAANGAMERVDKEAPVSVIKPRTRGKHLVRLVTRLDHENHETLHAYAQFLGETTEYVLNQLVDGVLAKDKEFRTWRTSHPESCVPTRRAHRKRAVAVSKAARSTPISSDAMRAPVAG